MRSKIFILFFVGWGIFSLSTLNAQNTAFIGHGLPQSPFLIEDARDLSNLAALVNANTAYTLGRTKAFYRRASYRLETDISLTETYRHTPIGIRKYPFSGVFDGNKRVIHDLSYTGDAFLDIGLFGVTSGAKITDVTLSNVSLTNKTVDDSSTGGLAGYAKNSEISNVTVAGGHIHGTEKTGGLIGWHYGEYRGTAVISTSMTSVEVTGDRDVGGLVGQNIARDRSMTRIAFSAASADIRGNVSIGGLVGKNIARDSGKATVFRSLAWGLVSAEENAGGLIGINHAQKYGRAEILASSASGAVSDRDQITQPVREPSKESASSPESVINATLKASVDEPTGFLGGLVGANIAYEGTAIIRQSYATGDVTGSDDLIATGGLIGENFSTRGGQAILEMSYMTGRVAGSTQVGGLVGRNFAIYKGTSRVTNSYSTGSVEAMRHVGGLVGWNGVGEVGSTALVEASYARTTVTGGETEFVGGLVGTLDGQGGAAVVVASYWDNDVWQGISPYGEGQSASRLKDSSSDESLYETWNFRIWDFGSENEFPVLKGLPVTVEDQRIAIVSSDSDQQEQQDQQE